MTTSQHRSARHSTTHTPMSGSTLTLLEVEIYAESEVRAARQNGGGWNSIDPIRRRAPGTSAFCNAWCVGER